MVTNMKNPFSFYVEVYAIVSHTKYNNAR